MMDATQTQSASTYSNDSVSPQKQTNKMIRALSVCVSLALCSHCLFSNQFQLGWHFFSAWKIFKRSMTKKKFAQKLINEAKRNDASPVLFLFYFYFFILCKICVFSRVSSNEWTISFPRFHARGDILFAIRFLFIFSSSIFGVSNIKPKFMECQLLK